MDSFISLPGRGNGNPLKYSSLENPMDRGAWRVTVHGVSQSWTRPKWLSTLLCQAKGDTSGSCLEKLCLNPREFDEEFYNSCSKMGAHQISEWVGLESESQMLVTWSWPTLCDPMDCSLPGSSVHGILQARILEWVAMPFSRGSSQPRDPIWVSHTAGRFLTSEPPERTGLALL